MESFFSSLKTERIRKNLPHEGAGEGRHVRLYRMLLQPDPASLDPGLPQSYRLRTRSWGSLNELISVSIKPAAGHCFELLRQAYVNARYSPHYEINADELVWIAERVSILETLVKQICEARLSA